MGSETARQSLRAWAPWLCLWILVPLWQFRSMFFGDSLPDSADLLHLEFAIKYFFFQSLKNGALTLLYPDNLMGLSLVSNPVYALFYPPNVLYLLTDPIMAYKASFLAHYLFFGVGWVLVLRQLGITMPAAGAAVSIILSSGLFWSFHRVAMVDLQSSAWCGWTVYVFVVAQQRRRLSLAALAGCVAALAFLGGDPISAGLACVLAMLLSLMSFSEAAPVVVWGKDSWFYVKSLVAMGLGLILVVFPFLWQMSIFFPFSERVFGFKTYEGLSYSSHPIRLLDVIFPWWLPPLDDAAFPLPAIRYGFGNGWWYKSLAIGLVAFLVGIIGARQFAKKPLSLLYLFIPLALMVLACGIHLPGGAYLWSHVPPLSSMRFPERLLRHAFISSLPVLALGMMVVYRRLAGQWPRRASWLMALMVGMSLIEINSSLPSLFMKPFVASAPYPPFPRLISDSAQAPNQVRVLDCYHIGGNGRFIDTRIWHLPMFFAPDPAESSLQKFFKCQWLQSHRALQWAGVSHVVLPPASPMTIDRLKTTFHATVYDNTPNLPVTILSVAEAGPHLARTSTSLTLGQVIERVSEGEQGIPQVDVVKPFAAIAEGYDFVDPRWIMRGGYPRVADNGVLAPLQHFVAKCPAPSILPLSMDENVNTIAFQTTVNCPHFVSLPWAFVPGWRAFVNDHEVPIYRVNDQTMGILLGEGDNKVHLYFEPPFFFTSLMITLCFLAFLMLFIIWEERRAREQPATVR